ncbi:MAG: MarR family winged helix-turn-helix transcriptional regulator [Syntrophales bacterium]
MKRTATCINRDVLSLVSDLCQVVRFCRQDATFCEDVTFTQFLILDEIAKKKVLKMQELRRILAVDKSTTTRLVNPLVRQGLIERKISNHDSRAVNLTLTLAGRKVHRKVWLCLEGFVGAIDGQIPNKRRKLVYEAVKLFIDAVKKASSACPCSE